MNAKNPAERIFAQKYPGPLPKLPLKVPENLPPIGGQSIVTVLFFPS